MEETNNYVKEIDAKHVELEDRARRNNIRVNHGKIQKVKFVILWKKKWVSKSTFSVLIELEGNTIKTRGLSDTEFQAELNFKRPIQMNETM